MAVRASAAPEEPVGGRGFFDMYSNGELASLLEVHRSLFPNDDAADRASVGGEDVKLEGEFGSFGGLHESILGAIAEIDAANRANGAERDGNGTGRPETSQ